jgi:ribonuclease BN (tRNA processing enzyme)
MEIRVLGCNGGILPGFRSSSFLINERVLIDSGHVADVLTLEEQNRIRDIFITHFHLDHTKDIAFLTDNAFGNHNLPISVYGTEQTVSDFKEFYFNNATWPDFTKINSGNQPIVRLVAVRSREKTVVGGMEVTSFVVNHSIDGVGYIVRDGSAAVVFSGDTGPTDALWDIVNNDMNVKALFVDTSFPNDLQTIADSSGHFTPMTLDADLKKLARNTIPIYLYHLKPQYYDVIIKEVKALKRDNLIILENGLRLNF